MPTHDWSCPPNASTADPAVDRTPPSTPAAGAARRRERPPPWRRIRAGALDVGGGARRAASPTTPARGGSRRAARSAAGRDPTAHRRSPRSRRRRPIEPCGTSARRTRRTSRTGRRCGSDGRPVDPSCRRRPSTSPEPRPSGGGLVSKPVSRAQARDDQPAPRRSTWRAPQGAVPRRVDGVDDKLRRAVDAGPSRPRDAA